ncbi:MAG: hypothetical protein COA78_37075 [Blastopirellula sp.]|nr:MAG: hypothetical protein COA78_37075 [Blastopirellula sp.]
MVARIGLSLGRQRITSKVSPHQSGYVVAIRNQMKGITKELERLIKNVEGATPEALKFGLQPIFDKSQKYVPVDKGRLKRSGFLNTSKTSRGARANIGYDAGGRLGYASIVHERTDVRHTAPTSAKFLEKAVNEHLQDIQPRMIRHIRSRTGLKE